MDRSSHQESLELRIANCEEENIRLDEKIRKLEELSEEVYNLAASLTKFETALRLQNYITGKLLEAIRQAKAENANINSQVQECPIHNVSGRKIEKD